MNEKHYLGELCDLGHEYENTGQSLRYESDGSCIECRNLAKKLRTEERKAKNEGKYYLGELCVAGHKHEGQNNSLRYVSSNHCVECRKLNDKKSYDARRDKILEQKKQYHINNKEILNNKNKEYYQKNRVNVIKKNKEYYEENKTHLNKKDWERKKQRLVEEPIFRLNSRMSNAITKALKLKNTSKNGLSYLDYVDFTIEELKEHLEKQFTEGMSWENYGKWHVDHIVAKAHFDYQLPTDASFKECWSLKNFQPLWSTDNLSKGTKSMEEFIKSKNELNIE